MRKALIMLVEYADEHIVSLKPGVVFPFAFDGNAEKARRFEFNPIAQIHRKPKRIETRSEVGAGRRYTDCQSRSLTDGTNTVKRQGILGKII